MQIGKKDLSLFHSSEFWFNWFLDLDDHVCLGPYSICRIEYPSAVFYIAFVGNPRPNPRIFFQENSMSVSDEGGNPGRGQRDPSFANFNFLRYPDFHSVPL